MEKEISVPLNERALSLPKEFLKRMENELGKDFPAFLKEYEKPPLRGFRVNTLKISPDEAERLFPYSKGRVSWCPEGFYYDMRPGKEPAYRCGLIYSQEPSAMIAAEELAPSPGDRVLDLCAAPGGKSTQIGAALQGEGLLVSNEIVPSRAAALAENIERMGIKNAVVTNMSPEKMEKEFPCYFDKIMVDAPCSGEGMFRRDNAAISEWSPENVHSCAQRQRLILESAVKMLRGGGVMVYSTCTFSKEENEDNAMRLAEAHPELTLVSMKRIMPHTHKGEGHFAAKFVKSGEEYIPRKPEVSKAESSLFEEFAEESLTCGLKGRYVSFGDRLYLLTEDFGSLERIKAVRPGLFLGENKKGRFEPSHGLCMALKKEDFVRSIEIDDAQSERYYKGEALEGGGRGFTAVLWKGFPMGWGKAVNGIIKNHIPKYLRG